MPPTIPEVGKVVAPLPNGHRTQEMEDVLDRMPALWHAPAPMVSSNTDSTQNCTLTFKFVGFM